MVCTSWTVAQWAVYESRRHVHKCKFSAMSPSGGGSALMSRAMQAKVHREQVPYVSQPSQYHDMTCHYYSFHLAVASPGFL